VQQRLRLSSSALSIRRSLFVQSLQNVIIHRWGWFRSLIVLLCLLYGAPSLALAQSRGETMTLARYQEEIVIAEELLAQPDGDDHLASVRQTFAAIQEVELPSGAVITLLPLLGEPAEEKIDLATARLRLSTVRNELLAAPEDETAARLLLLTSIFQQPEFVERDSLWQRFWRWLRSWLPTVDSSEQEAGAGGAPYRWLGLALIGLGAVLLIWLLSYWLQTLLGSFIGGGERPQGNDALESPPTAAAARTSAHKLADAGSYREAVRHLYLSALLTLHERNLITYQPSDTNREVLRAVRNQPLLHQQLQPVIATFDDVWYGVHEPDRTSFDNYVAAVAKLEEVK
jgi:hypothetical protein